MGMRVPNVPEWQGQPGFWECECDCVRVARKAWPDCISCGGTGRIGIVPDTVYDWAVEKFDLPGYTGDVRFDPKAAISARMMRTVVENEERRKEWMDEEEQEARLTGVVAIALAMVAVAAFAMVAIVEVFG